MKFGLGCKNLDNQARSGRPKTVDSECYIAAFLSKKITLTLFLERGVCGMETEGDEHRLPCLPITSSSSLDYTTVRYFQDLTSLPFLLPGQGPVRAITLQVARRPVSVTDRIKIQDPRFKTPVRLSVSSVCCVYVISQRLCVPVFLQVTCFRLFTQVHPAITLFTQLEHPALSKVSIPHMVVLVKIK